ncbi:MAG: DUF2142 domain-containing protein [Clostridia bacterium]|nr:DUF2142 domain-containing protein [Clostridia bacterium]
MKKAEKWFLCLFIPLSLLMMIVLPIYRAPDELAHLQQAYTIADGQLFSSFSTGTRAFPENFAGDVVSHELTLPQLPLLSEDLSENRVILGTNTATAIYPPISYVPQALGMWLAMLFTSNRLVIFYAARVVNWLCTMAVLWWGIRKIPKGKWIFLFLSILPMNLQQIVSASADGMATAIVFALSAFVVHAVMEKPKFTWREYAVMALMSVGLVCWKVFYAPMVLIFLLIPRECFASRRRKIAVQAGYILGTFALILGWALICYVNFFSGASEGIEGSTVSMIDYLLHHPWDYFVRMLMDLRYRGVPYIGGMFAVSMSWGNIDIGIPLSVSSMLLCLAIFAAEKTPKMTIKARVALAGTSILCVLIVYLLLYVWWTPMDSAMIQGFQGRYLIPLTLPVMLAVKPPQWHKEKLLPYLMGAAVLVNIGFLIRIVQHVAV